MKHVSPNTPLKIQEEERISANDVFEHLTKNVVQFLTHNINILYGWMTFHSFDNILEDFDSLSTRTWMEEWINVIATKLMMDS